MLSFSHWVGGNRKRQYYRRMKIKKSLEIEFSIAICPPTGDKCQLKTLFLSIFNPRSSIVKSVFYCRLPGVILLRFLQFRETIPIQFEKMLDSHTGGADA